ncbi:MAG: UvrD-helicase domain-containing protein [Nitrospira sp.]|nr:UvrD-helicase domain-containing protein [bacterium]MBL7048212.1 UvrD-helicase domain-containing protein [Nitrospira sp.]
MTKQSLLSGLNSQQKDAVLHTTGPLLVLAGAGSGKTRVLAHRFANLSELQKVQPASILTMAFTNKAAKEMKEQIENLTGKSTKGLWIGTFPSLSTRILRKEINKLGYSNDFCIYDEEDSGHLVRSMLKELKIHEALYKGILSKISTLKASLITPEELLANEDSYGFDEKFAKVYVRYSDALKQNNALDFDDLTRLTVKLYEDHPKILSKYQKEFEHILVDEFQDTNPSQYRLAQLLASKHNNICVAGDDDQSIYKFKGSEIRNIHNFKNDFQKATVIHLEQNYRSTQHILNVATGVINVSKDRIPKKLWSDRIKGDKVCYCSTLNEKEEARFISQSIKELYQKGKYTFKDIAILYRVPQQSRVIEESLKENGQPYHMFGGISFYKRKEIKDIISYMKVVANPDDTISLKRIINCPPRQIGAATMTKIENEAKKKETSLFNAMKSIMKNNGFSASIKDKMGKFITLMNGLIKSRKMDAGELIKAIYDKTGYLEYAGEDKNDNLMELINAAEGQDLRSFLDRSSLYRGLDTQQAESSITMMTLHSAKGLEFPVVFIAGIEDGLMPHFHAIKDKAELDEERRLFYVGITRAQDMLMLSGAKRRQLYASVQDQQPSRFLADIPTESYKVVEKRPRADAISAPRIKVPASAMGSATYATGVRVKHPKWGIGVVRDTYGETDDVKVMVNFPVVGIKKLSLKYANLEKI